MDTVELQRELQAIQRGRGLARPRVRSWVGPLLRELLGDTGHQPEGTLRDELIASLVDACAALPADLRFLMLVATGIDSDRPTLSARLAVAAEVLQRDARTLSRRLRQAEALIASLLLPVERSPEQAFEVGAWATRRLVLDVDVAVGRPVAVVRQVIRPLRADQREFRHTIAVAAPVPDADTPEVSARVGCRVASVERQSERSWVVIFEVPALGRGRSHEVEFEVRFPRRELLMPFAAFAPLRPCASMEVRVHLGDPPLTTEVWAVRGVPPALVTDRPRGAQQVSLDKGVASASFTALRPGFAYGLAWR